MAGCECGAGSSAGSSAGNGDKKEDLRAVLLQKDERDVSRVRVLPQPILVDFGPERSGINLVANRQIFAKRSWSQWLCACFSLSGRPVLFDHMTLRLGVNKEGFFALDKKLGEPVFFKLVYRAAGPYPDLSMIPELWSLMALDRLKTIVQTHLREKLTYAIMPRLGRDLADYLELKMHKGPIGGLIPQDWNFALRSVPQDSDFFKEARVRRVLDFFANFSGVGGFERATKIQPDSSYLAYLAKLGLIKMIHQMAQTVQETLRRLAEFDSRRMSSAASTSHSDASNYSSIYSSIYGSTSMAGLSSAGAGAGAGSSGDERDNVALTPWVVANISLEHFCLNLNKTDNTWAINLVDFSRAHRVSREDAQAEVQADMSAFGSVVYTLVRELLWALIKRDSHQNVMTEFPWSFSSASRPDELLKQMQILLDRNGLAPLGFLIQACISQNPVGPVGPVSSEFERIRNWRELIKQIKNIERDWPVFTPKAVPSVAGEGVSVDAPALGGRVKPIPIPGKAAASGVFEEACPPRLSDGDDSSVSAFGSLPEGLSRVGSSGLIELLQGSPRNSQSSQNSLVILGHQIGSGFKQVPPHASPQ